MKELPIDQGTRVTLHFALRFTDGQEIDSTFDKAPASLEIGDENLPENFEAYLMGKTTEHMQTYCLIRSVPIRYLTQSVISGPPIRYLTFNLY